MALLYVRQRLLQWKNNIAPKEIGSNSTIALKKTSELGNGMSLGSVFYPSRL